MAFYTTWLHEPHTLYTHFDGHVTGNDLKITMVEYLGALQLQPAYFLMDFLDVNSVPARLLDFPLLLQVLNHGNMQWMVFLKREAQYSVMTQMLSRDKVKTFRDFKSGEAFLRSMVRLDTGIALSALQNAPG